MNKKNIKHILMFLLALFISRIIQAELEKHSTTELNKAKKEYIKPLKTKFAIYMAADNDLFPFARRNLKQLQNIGSNENIKIYVHFDLHPAGQPKMSKRLIIEKGKIIQVGPDRVMDSGDTQTLIDFAKWFITEDDPETETVRYNHVCILWNHGTGAIEPNIKHAFNPSNLWSENPSSRLIELDRNIGFLDFLARSEESFNRKQNFNHKRGICFDDTTGHYLTNQKLKQAFSIIKRDFLKRDLDIIGCDACLMEMLEVAGAVKDYAKLLVGSQEVELGTGWDYYKVLKPFLTNKLDPITFANHIVNAYENAYSKITNDYTQSALDLKKVTYIEENLEQLSKTLIKGLKNQKGRSVKEAVKLSRHKSFCTHFDEPTYIDIDHFYSNLLKNINKFELNSAQATDQFKKEIQNTINQGKKIIEKSIISNKVGQNLKNARGISICFPDRYVHNSYYQYQEALPNWIDFIISYLAS